MPSGYTAPVMDGEITGLRAFALRCARAFCIHQREDNPSNLPKRTQVSSYHPDAIAYTKQRLKSLEEMDRAEIEYQIDAEFVKEYQRRREAKAQNELGALRYRDMLAKVERWGPPSLEHSKFKQFMIDQLEESIRHDVHDDTFWAPPTKLSPEIWLSQRIESEKGDIEYHTKSLAREEAAVAQQNRWIEMLYESLPST